MTAAVAQQAEPVARDSGEDAGSMPAGGANDILAQLEAAKPFRRQRYLGRHLGSRLAADRFVHEKRIEVLKRQSVTVADEVREIADPLLEALRRELLR